MVFVRLFIVRKRFRSTAHEVLLSFCLQRIVMGESLIRSIVRMIVLRGRMGFSLFFFSEGGS